MDQRERWSRTNIANERRAALDAVEPLEAWTAAHGDPHGGIVVELVAGGAFRLHECGCGRTYCETV